MHELFFQIVLIAIASVGAHWIAWKMHIPAILFLLVLGFVLGPFTGLLEPNQFLGEVLGPAVQAAVAIILFEGALHLRLKDLREAKTAVWRVILIGAPLGCYLITQAAHHIGGLSLPVAATLGGMLVVTGPTVIMPMLRQARLNPRLGAVLKWEGIVNDPLGVLFAVLAYEFFLAQAGETSTDSGFFLTNGIILMLVCAASYTAAHVMKRLFEHGHMPEYLKAPFVLAMVLSLFYLSNLMLHESGLIAVTILGMTLTNIHTASLAEIQRFKETITLLLVSGVFLLLTASLDMSTMLNINFRSILFILALLFIVRPITIGLATLGSSLSWKEVLLAGWIAPRGVVCAAMAGVLGPSLVNAGFEGGDQVLPIAFVVVLVSVILHSLTIKPMAERLHLKTKESGGLIITGVNDWVLQLAEVLQKQNVPVLIVDNKYLTLKEARMHGLPTYYGELLSEEVEFALEFVKYNSLIAATPSPAYNALVCDKFGYEFGRERVFRVPPDNEGRKDRVQLAEHIRGKLWAREDFSNLTIANLYKEGWRFRTTRVGMNEEDKSLVMPKESENLVIVGIMNKNIGIQLRPQGVKPNAKENDRLLLFSKEVVTPENAPKEPAEKANTEQVAEEGKA